jgi:hypothetical protein
MASAFLKTAAKGAYAIRATTFQLRHKEPQQE